MSILTERPPETVVIDGHTVEIDGDFRTILRIQKVYSETTSEAKAVVLALRMFYKRHTPINLQEAAEQMLWFIRRGKEAEEAASEERMQDKQDFSFEYDAPMIYAAFLDQYRIDLTEVAFLHWWKFRALIDGLRADHSFCEIRRCRSMDLSKVRDKDQRQYYREMQKRYALPLPEKDKRMQDAITQALLNGGDVSSLLTVENEEQEEATL